MIFLAADPGVDGAIALWAPDEPRLLLLDMPTLTLKRSGSNKREINVAALANGVAEIAKANITFAMIERSGTRDGQSISTALQSGMNEGILRGMFAAFGFPTQRLLPQSWKKAMRVTANKDSSRNRASELLPQWADKWALAKHHNRAEAALMALYAERLHLAEVMKV